MSGPRHTEADSQLLTTDMCVCVLCCATHRWYQSALGSAVAYFPTEQVQSAAEPIRQTNRPD